MTCFYCDYEWCWLCSAPYTEDHFEPMNPLGCGGMMFTDKKHHWFLMFLWKLLCLLLIIILYPFVLVFTMPVVCINFFFNCFEIGEINEPDLDAENLSECFDCCCNLVDCYGCDYVEGPIDFFFLLVKIIISLALGFSLGMIANILVVPLAILATVIGIPVALFLLCKERHKVRKEAKERLREIQM